MATEGRNVKYLSNLEFDKTLIHATPDLKEVIGNYKIILVAAHHHPYRGHGL